MFGWSQVEMIHINASSEPLSKGDLPPETIEEIMALNWADIELYQFAQAVFGMQS
jgi:hypothetical protein